MKEKKLTCSAPRLVAMLVMAGNLTGPPAFLAKMMTMLIKVMKTTTTTMMMMMMNTWQQQGSLLPQSQGTPALYSPNQPSSPYPASGP